MHKSDCQVTIRTQLNTYYRHYHLLDIVDILISKSHIYAYDALHTNVSGK